MKPKTSIAPESKADIQQLNARIAELEKSLHAKAPSSFRPNTFGTPNIIVDLYGDYLTSEEKVCLQYACRHILGWRDYVNERRRKMSLTFFLNGRPPKFSGCGLKRNALINALHGLSKFGLLKKIGEPDERGQEWGIPEDEGEVDFEGLKQRHAETLRQNQKRTAAGRKAKLAQSPNIIGDDDAQKTTLETGLWDKPEPVCGTNRRWFVPQTH